MYIQKVIKSCITCHVFKEKMDEVDDLSVEWYVLLQGKEFATIMAMGEIEQCLEKLLQQQDNEDNIKILEECLDKCLYCKADKPIIAETLYPIKEEYTSDSYSLITKTDEKSQTRCKTAKHKNEYENPEICSNW